MFPARSILSLLALLPLTALATPLDPATHSLTRRRDGDPIHLYVDPNCGTDSRYEKIKRTISDARLLAKDIEEEYFKQGKWQLTAKRYFAIDTIDKTPLEGSQQFVMESLRNLAVLEDPTRDAPPDDHVLWQTIRISCKDEFYTCATMGPGTFAYARNDADEIGRPFYAIIICTDLFDQTRDLQNIVEEYSKKPRQDVTMNNLESAGGKFLHELMHIDLITNQRGHFIDERSKDDVRLYGAVMISQEALDRQNREKLMRNPDSYTQFTQEIFYTKQFGFRPAVQLTTNPTLNCIGGEPGRREHWVVRDEALKPIEEFCNELGPYYDANQGYYNIGSLEKTWYEGTPGATRLKAHWDTTANMSPGHLKADCTEKMMAILDSCDTDSKYKHAGNYDSMKDTGTKYEIDFVSKRLNSVSVPTAFCDVWYPFPAPYNQAYMRGSGFASNDWGQSKLLPGLHRCHGVTGWTFDYKQSEINGVLYEWEAYSNILIGAQQWGCVREAMISAGAPESLGCGGR